jgi:hypothetical protein
MILEPYRQDWPEKGVSILVPPQDSGVTVIGVERDMPRSIPDRPNFRLDRPVINFEIEDAEKTGAVLREFKPPFELRVRYTQDDLERAMKAGRPLTLAFWDGEHWVLFTREKHDFELRPNTEPGTGGTGFARISHWGDPPVGWGD